MNCDAAASCAATPAIAAGAELEHDQDHGSETHATSATAATAAGAELEHDHERGDGDTLESLARGMPNAYFAT